MRVVCGFVVALGAALPAVAEGVAPAGSAPVERGGWVQAETEHFRFIFEPRDRAAVDELLTYCEPIYQRVTGFFHMYPKKVPVIVHGRIEFAGNSAAELNDNELIRQFYLGV